jgi:hypothetical protein
MNGGLKELLRPADTNNIKAWRAGRADGQHSDVTRRTPEIRIK